MFSDASPVEWDRRLGRAQAAWLAFRDRLSDGVLLTDHPLAAFHQVTGRTLFSRLGELPESDPLRQPLRRWVYRLAEQRINHAALVEQAAAWNEPHELRDSPTAGRASLREMLAGCLGDPARAEPWAVLLGQRCGRVSRAAVMLWQRRREVSRRMGLATPSELESPAPNVVQTAESYHRATRERVRELRATTIDQHAARSIGSDLPGDWPARMTPAHLLDPFREGDLFRSLELRPRRLPRALGPASYCHALQILGEEWLEALAPRDQPFAIAHDAYGLARHRAGALFASLPLNAAFLQRKLGVSKASLRDGRRQLAELALLELSRAALRVRLRGPALAGERELREAFVELTHQELGLRLPAAMAGAWLRLRTEDPQRWVGLVTVADTETRLSNEHDEDWFRNPRAIEQLRAEAQLPPETHLSEPALAEGIRATLRRLDELLD